MARAESTINASPQPEDSHLVPGVEKIDAEAGEVLDDLRHDGKAVLKGRGGRRAVPARFGAVSEIALQVGDILSHLKTDFRKTTEAR